MVFCALLCIVMSFYVPLCFFAPLSNLMPFVHPFYASLCVIIMRPSAFLCIRVQSHTSYVLLRILVILAHHCASFAFLTILMLCYAFPFILMSFCAPSEFLWPSLCIRMPFSVSSCLSIRSCASSCLSMRYHTFWCIYPHHYASFRAP